MNHVHSVNDETFAAEVEGASGLILVDFWAPWCGPCKIIAPTLERLAEEYRGTATIIKLNIDESPATARRFGVRSIPSILFFNDGLHVDTVIGAASQAVLAVSIERHLVVPDAKWARPRPREIT